MIEHNGSKYLIVTRRDENGVVVTVIKDGEALIHMEGKASLDVAGDYEGQLDEKIERLLERLMEDEIRAGRLDAGQS